MTWNMELARRAPCPDPVPLAHDTGFSASSAQAEMQRDLPGGSLLSSGPATPPGAGGRGGPVPPARGLRLVNRRFQHVLQLALPASSGQGGRRDGCGPRGLGFLGRPGGLRGCAPVSVAVWLWPCVRGHMSVVRTRSRASGPTGKLGSVAWCPRGGENSLVDVVTSRHSPRAGVEGIAHRRAGLGQQGAQVTRASCVLPARLSLPGPSSGVLRSA